MKKFLVIIIGLGLFVLIAQVWQAQFCKKVIKDMSASEAKEKYEKCLKW